VVPGNEFYYAHLSRLAVAAGQQVGEGSLIGWSGSANGVAHLHFAERGGNPETLLGLPSTGGAPFKGTTPAAKTALRTSSGGLSAQQIRRKIALASAQPYNINRVLTSQANLSGFGGIQIVGDQTPFLGAASAGAGASKKGRQLAGVPQPGDASGVLGLIVAGGHARDLDAAALLAVAAQEGLSGRIGDSGHAYGPFQLNNAGGVLTGIKDGTNSQAIQAWAMGQAGISFALDRIQNVAAGLTGNRAVEAIVRRFERPANPDREVQRAELAYPNYTQYRQLGGRVPKWGGWHADGLDQVYNTPTVLGVGERGAERVTVTPHRGGGRQAPGPVTFNNKFEINGGDPTQVKKQIEDALHQFAEDLDRHFGSDVAEGSSAY
jgi:hypothetical protein